MGSAPRIAIDAMGGDVGPAVMVAGAALAHKRRSDISFLLFGDEGHGFAKPENRMKFFAVAEQFLARHLGGRFEE